MRGDLARYWRVDQRAVGGQADVEAHRLGAARDLENIRPQQRLAAGKDQHRHAESLQVVHHREDLRGRQLAGKILVGRNRVAVLAGQVAAPDQVPDHHRSGRIALRPDAASAAAISCMNCETRNTLDHPPRTDCSMLRRGKLLQLTCVNRPAAPGV